ncbi:SRPBCC family protein [Sphingobacterium paludis]|uniref:Activator of Hsp90 ATPase-like protein n=1 Tax=Sphingobacterium paludis TaxID=1476465 RepID=A0A4R7D6A8_9SPHI|nr:SRPBCC domain-containing protein [Sphingobacterium paludis]TDS16107.1 activator of Hsp90 ATPase-like protein [Sphingobacterium paludis]
MKKSTYRIDIHAAANNVFRIMLERDTYRQWTEAFDPASDYSGGWNKGDKIYFLGPSENGKRQGMIAEIAEHIPDQFISIRHYGMLDGDEEITSGPKVEAWAGIFENYTFEEQAGVTTVTVDVDSPEQDASFFDEAWPRALHKLKHICEKS